MKRYLHALLVGFAAWLMACVLPIFFWADPLWLMRVSVVPTALACLLLALLSPSVYHRRLTRHLTAFLVGYFAVVLSVALGAAAAQILRVGYDRTNVSGYFVWSWIYGAIFLPASYPTSLAILHVSLPR